MGGAVKEKAELARADAVQRLRALAAQIEQGSIALGGQTFEIPEEVHLEIKAESHELELELEWKSPAEEAEEEEEGRKAEDKRAEEASLLPP